MDECYPVNQTFFDTFSSIDVENLNFNLYPRFNEVEILEADLEPVDVLYIPQRWWDDIRSLSPSISVNFWWINEDEFSKQLAEELSGSDSYGFDKKNSYIRVVLQNLMREYDKNGISGVSGRHVQKLIKFLHGISKPKNTRSLL